MKRKTLIIILAVVLPIVLIVIGAGIFIGGAVIFNLRAENRLESEPPKEKYKTYSKSFGKYKVPSNWVESKSHSTGNKFFYVLNGHENDTRPNNISINKGTNKYSTNEHDKFRKSILQQLSMQVGSRDDVTINASGLTTDNGYIVYKFIIYESDNNITTTQYYIVGDYQYILVHETVFDEYLDDTDNVAWKIVNTFTWK